MKTSILVIDDNLINRKLACDLLEMENHEVWQCEDAQGAIALLGKQIPDLILMDISLPGMDGLTLTRLLKKDPKFAHVPIVAMTAFAMKGDEQKALAAGCSGYITKPINTRQLPQQVERYLLEARGAPEQLRIMIVEDHRIDLKFAGDTAKLSGHVVLSNTTAEEALKSLDEGHPDVVLLDLNLPGIDGLAFVKLLKSDPKTASLPVVAVTAYPDAFRRDELLRAGCTAYIVKPVDMKRLMAELEAASTPPANNRRD